MTRRKQFLFAGLIIPFVILFSALGVWQLQRLQWKLDLIGSVERGISSPPVAAPLPNTAQNIAPYQKVFTEGSWIRGKDTLVLAVTKMGRGYWVLTPLRTNQCFTVLVNRGFVPETVVKDEGWNKLAEGEVEITGLLRSSEGTKAFLRHNDPVNDRWYARNVDGIASARELENIAPYFIDADKPLSEGPYPAAGLTVVSFRNNHLVYAVTWFLLALGCLGATWWVLVAADKRRDRD